MFFSIFLVFFSFFFLFFFSFFSCFFHVFFLVFFSFFFLFKKENNKLNRLIASLDSQNKFTDPNLHLPFELKRKINELEKLLSQKSQDMRHMKQTIKYTKILEIECENQRFLDENFRLKALISSQLSSQKTPQLPINADNFVLQHKIIVEMKENAKNSHYSLVKKDEEIERILVENELLHRKTSRFLEEIKNLKNSLKRSSQEVLVFQQESANLSMKISQLLQQNPEKIHEKSVIFDDKIDKNAEKGLRNLLSQKEQVILYQEKTISELRRKGEENMKENRFEREILEKELKKLKEFDEDLNEKYKILLNLRTLEEKKRAENQVKDQNLSLMTTRPASRTLAPFSKKKEDICEKNKTFLKKVHRVSAEEIQKPGFELRLRLEIKAIKKEDLEEILFRKDEIFEGKISLKSMKMILEE